MYFPDLSPYIYDGEKEDRGILNVGWLDDRHPYDKGVVSEEFLSKLWALCKDPEFLSFGYHTCDFCHKNFGVRVSHDGEALRVGSGEIRVAGDNGLVYIAPDMIFHYIVDHQYLPPGEFIDAVEKAVSPGG